MIIATYEQLPVGYKGFGKISDANGVFVKMPMIVLRDSSRAEYLDYVRENANIPNLFTEEQLKKLNYYQVSVD